jgi:hypothetical protein
LWGGVIMERLTELKAHLKPIGSGPVLWRVNGCGFTLHGWLKDELLDPYIIKMHWFTFLWIPIFPLAVYVVDRADVDQYRIFRKMSFWRFHKIYWGRLTRFYLTVAGESVLWIVGIIAALAFTIFILAAFKYGFRALFR